MRWWRKRRQQYRRQHARVLMWWGRHKRRRHCDHRRGFERRYGEHRQQFVSSGRKRDQSEPCGQHVGSACQHRRLVVSSGPAPTVTVPNVVGQAQAAATTAITTAGLRVGTVTNARVPQCLGQRDQPGSRRSGTSVATNSAVNLDVSAGESPVRHPHASSGCELHPAQSKRRRRHRSPLCICSRAYRRSIGRCC